MGCFTNSLFLLEGFLSLTLCPLCSCDIPRLVKPCRLTSQQCGSLFTYLLTKLVLGSSEQKQFLIFPTLLWFSQCLVQSTQYLNTHWCWLLTLFNLFIPIFSDTVASSASVCSEIERGVTQNTRKLILISCQRVKGKFRPQFSGPNILTVN